MAPLSELQSNDSCRESSPFCLLETKLLLQDQEVEKNASTPGFSCKDKQRSTDFVDATMSE